KIGKRVKSFAGGDGASRSLFHLSEQVQTLRHDRLLAPDRVESLKRRIVSMAHPAESRPWNSIIKPTCGPTAWRTAATIPTAASLSSGDISFQAMPNGSNFSAR